MKIAILLREETAQRCTGKGCLRAFYEKGDSFARYKQDIELVAFTHVGGDLDYKIEKMLAHGVEVVHLSSCLRAKSDEYEVLVDKLSNYFDVVGYTHGSEIGKNKAAIILEKKRMLKEKLENTSFKQIDNTIRK